MRALMALALLSTSILAHAKRFAVVMVGGANEEKHEFLVDESDNVAGLIKGGWEPTVLMSSERASEWSAMPASVRPSQNKMADHQFNLRNYRRVMANIVSKAGPGDEVSLELSAHGAVIAGRHIIGWEDNREKGILSTTGTMISDVLTPTEKIFPEIEQLLQKGAKVHFNLFSCYSGQAFTDAARLLEKYPDQLCITTSTSSDRESFFVSFFTKAVHRGSGVSVEEAFIRWQGPDEVISSIPDWNEIQAKRLPDFFKKQKYDPYQVICELEKDPELSYFLQKQIAPVLGAQENGGPVERYLKLKQACTVAAKQRTEAYADAVEKLDQKYGSTAFTVGFVDHPSFFRVDRSSKNVVYGFTQSLCPNFISAKRPEELTMTFTVPKLDFEEMACASGRQHSESEIADFFTRIGKMDKNGKMLKALQEYRKEEKLAQQFMRLPCEDIDQVKIAAKNHLIEFRKNRPKACANFKY